MTPDPRSTDIGIFDEPAEGDFRWRRVPRSALYDGGEFRGLEYERNVPAEEIVAEQAGYETRAKAITAFHDLNPGVSLTHQIFREDLEEE